MTLLLLRIDRAPGAAIHLLTVICSTEEAAKNLDVQQRAIVKEANMCVPSGGGGGDNSGANAAQQQQQQEQARQARIKAGNASIDKTFGQFDDNFYAGRSKAYTDWAQPQLEDQYADQRKALVFGLSRNGLLSSTVGNEKTAHLKKQYDMDRIQLADQALAEATKARSAVNNTKMDLQNQLIASSDPSSAASNALAAARVNTEQLVRIRPWAICSATSWAV